VNINNNFKVSKPHTIIFSRHLHSARVVTKLDFSGAASYGIMREWKEFIQKRVIITYEW
jgi:hypothetical protein